MKPRQQKTEKMPHASAKPIIDGDRICKATNVKIKTLHPIFLGLAQSLASIGMLRFIKISNDGLSASNLLSTDGKKEPLVDTNRKDLVGVELLIDPAFKTVQFFAIVSFKKGNGRKMVAAVVEATPADWQLAVAKDWSGGFWEKMREEYPRITIFQVNGGGDTTQHEL